MSDLAAAMQRIAVIVDKMDKTLDRHERVAAATKFIDRRYEIEAALRPVVHKAAKVLRVPMCSLILIGGETAVLVALYAEQSCGITREVYPRTKSYCQIVSGTGEPFMTEDGRHDDVVRALRSDIDETTLPAYYGAPVFDPTGLHSIGSFCVADTVPRHWRNSEMALVNAYAEHATSVLADLA